MSKWKNLFPPTHLLPQGRRGLRRAMALGGLTITLAACTVAPTFRSGPYGARSTPGPVSASARPASGSTSDASQVAASLGPSVAELIVGSRGNVGLGSGFVIAHDQQSSYLVTNNHVVQGSTQLQVLMPDGQAFPGTVKGTDPVEDVAVVRVDNPSLPLTTFADSGKLQVGQQVIAIGNPLGEQGSVTMGIISALHRQITAGTSNPGSGSGSETLPDLIQTDASINPGNSGGPLADASGQVVGMNTAGSSTANGIGYAIPSLIVARVANDLIAGRQPGHPFMGVSVLSEDTAILSGVPVRGYGYIVKSVTGGCPAEQAGIRIDDVIQSIGGVELKNGQTLSGALQQHSPGEQVPVNVLRAGSTAHLTVKLTNQPTTGGSC